MERVLIVLTLVLLKNVLCKNVGEMPNNDLAKVQENVKRTSIVAYNKLKMTKDEIEKEERRIENVCQCKVEILTSVGAFILTYDSPSHPGVDTLNLDPLNEVGAEDQIVTLFNEEIPTDPDFNKQWALQDLANSADINAAEGWREYMSDYNGGDPNGPTVVVAVIDSGVDYNHPDLKDVMWTNPGEIPNNGKDDDGNGIVDDIYGADFSYIDGDPMDDDSHGTHCAGIVAAKENNEKGVAGVASFTKGKVKIMAVKGFPHRGSSQDSSLMKCLNYAIANGATISSNSWGGGDTSVLPLWKRVLQNNPDHLFVAAAGNDNSFINDKYRPVLCGMKEPNFLCVASSNRNDMKSSFSNYGKDYVHVFAPGSNIYSTIPNKKYDYKRGTSMACPHVSGLAALIRTMRPEMMAHQVREIIEDNVQKKKAYENLASSGGLIDMGKTIQALKGGTCDTSNWPDVDNEVICGNCKALIDKMNSRYITCDNYCKSIGRTCSGAWEESNDDCNIKSEHTCTHRFDYTSDAICECHSTGSGGTCDPSNWPDVDNEVICGNCKALIDKMNSRYITCDNYCKSIGRSCSGAWEESNDDCNIKSEHTCTHRFDYTSDAICECDSDGSGGTCDTSNWPDVDNEVICGNCKALIDKMNSRYITCDNYCKSIGRTCSGAWEESNDDCNIKSEHTCTHKFDYTSDAICECDSAGSGETCDPSNWPDVDNEVICGNCKALIDKMNSRYITCDNYCKSIGRSCSGAWEESNDDCNIKSEHTCTHRFDYTSDAICECDSAGSGGTCDPSNWPDVDNEMICGNCKALIDKMNSRYITCDNYCKSIGRTCSGAWEESNDDCNIKSELTCTHRFDYTSDAICECGKRK